MAYRVHPAVDPVEPAVADPSSNGGVVKAVGNELGAGYQPMLVSG